MSEKTDMPVTVVGELGGITYELLPLREASKKNNFAESYVRFLCDSGQLIATKYLNRWYVEKDLSKLQRQPPVQDTS